MYWYILCVVIVSGAVVAYLQSLGSLALVDLSDCCCFRSLPRLGELVDQILFERQLAQPLQVQGDRQLRQGPGASEGRPQLPRSQRRWHCL
jgi:hypothetical protein